VIHLIKPGFVEKKVANKNLFLFALLILFCSKGGHDLAGTTTETDSGTKAAIEGLIIYSDSSPVHGADVILHDQSLINIIMLGKKMAGIRSGSSVTNINGFFRFDSVDTGHFLVEVNDHDTLGALLKAQVRPQDTLVEANGVLRRMGSIQGRVDTSKIKGAGLDSVYLPEIGLKVAIDSAGYFTINNLPVWNYQVRVSIGDSIVHLPADTALITVVQGDTTRLSSFGSDTSSVFIKGKIVEQP
jgi:hypothetical protein